MRPMPVPSPAPSPAPFRPVQPRREHFQELAGANDAVEATVLEGPAVLSPAAFPFTYAPLPRPIPRPALSLAPPSAPPCPRPALSRATPPLPRPPPYPAPRPLTWR